MSGNAHAHVKSLYYSGKLERHFITSDRQLRFAKHINACSGSEIIPESSFTKQPKQQKQYTQLGGKGLA